MYDTSTFFLYDKQLQSNNNSIFNIVPYNGYYTIINSINQNLILFNTNLIKFANTNEVKTNENLFKLDITYEID